MAFTEEFIPDAGFKLRRDQVSILLQMHTTGKKLSEVQRYRFASALLRFLAGLGYAVAVPTRFRRAMRMQEFPDRASEPMIKLVSKDTWDRYMSQGRFQLGSIGYYRRSQNDQIRDGHEGLSLSSYRWQDREMHILLEVGANFSIFCGTHDPSPSAEVMSRFGNVAVVIPDVRTFADRIAERIGAISYRVHDVVYSDAKTFVADVNFSEFEQRVRAAGLQGDMSVELIHLMNVLLFEEMSINGLYPSVFAKPSTRYSVESERRIAFEMPCDLTEPVVQIEDRRLLDLVQAHSLE